MKMQMTGHMRMEQRMKLAPRMIQSMEILQLPVMALEERIEQELLDAGVERNRLDRHGRLSASG